MEVALDDARDLHAEGKGGLWSVLIFAFDHQKVGKVKPTRFDFNLHLIFFGRHVIDNF